MTLITRRKLFGLLASAGLGAAGLVALDITVLPAPTALAHTGVRVRGGYSLVFDRDSAEAPYRCGGSNCLVVDDFIIVELRHVAVHVDGRLLDARGHVPDGATYQWTEIDLRDYSRGTVAERVKAWNAEIHGGDA